MKKTMIFAPLILIGCQSLILSTHSEVMKLQQQIKNAAIKNIRKNLN